MLSCIVAVWLGVITATGSVLGGQAPAPAPAPAQPPAAPAPAAEAKATPEAQKVLDRVKAHYAGLKAAGVTVTMISIMTIEGDEQRHELSATVVAQRPNRFALKAGEEMGYSVVSDGTTLWQSIGDPFNMYSETKPPEGLGAIADASTMGPMTDAEMALLMPHILVITLLDQERFGTLCDRATTIEHTGTGEHEGRQYDRVRLGGRRMSTELWVRTGEAAWVDKVVPDISAMLAGMPGLDEEMKARMPRTEVALSAWTASPQIGPETFTFKPPEDAEKVESLQKAIEEEMRAGIDMGEEEHSDLLGKPAPALSLNLLEGGTMDLASHKGKEIVVLDFWATWCPPCVRGLPVVAEVTGSFKDNGVVFYAVNEREPAATIRKFLEGEDLKITVALDKNGKGGDAFEVSGIPQTVIIGKDGTVQAVHVGFSDDMEEQLRAELQSLVDGKTLATPAADKPKQERNGAAAPAGSLREVWSVPGHWTAGAADPRTGDIYAIGADRRLVRFDRDGKEISSVETDLPEPGLATTLRLANLAGDQTPEVVVFGSPMGAFCALDPQGKVLWEYTRGDGIDDVWVYDLDAGADDGRDEVIVGYNGFTGLHALKADGTLRWKSTSIGNVWHVTAGPTGPGGTPEVITTSASGALHVFDPAGKKGRDLRPRGYANLVRLGGSTPEGEPILVHSRGLGGGLAAMTRSGKQLWSTELEIGNSPLLSDGHAAPGKPWFAVADMSSVFVIDVRDGRVLASVNAGQMPKPMWVGGGDTPLRLVVGSMSGLRAYEVNEGAPAEQANPGMPTP